MFRFVFSLHNTITEARNVFHSTATSQKHTTRKRKNWFDSWFIAFCLLLLILEYPKFIAQTQKSIFVLFLFALFPVVVNLQYINKIVLNWIEKCPLKKGGIKFNRNVLLCYINCNTLQIPYIRYKSQFKFSLLCLFLKITLLHLSTKLDSKWYVSGSHTDTGTQRQNNITQTWRIVSPWWQLFTDGCGSETAPRRRTGRSCHAALIAHLHHFVLHS